MSSKRPLTTYDKKRKFDRTPEPRGGKPSGKRIYVIQKHDATRLHYDFRLEHNGVLLSWAVPKEPSTDPKVKRLAVHVEDHPIDYATFSGVIPEGNYGAGTVEIWDSGWWEPEGDVDRSLAKGELKVVVHGKRLNGRWVLVRMGPPSEKENWLLIKERHDTPEPEHAHLPDWTGKPPLKHELCELRANPPEGDEWRFEIKWDGYRAFLIVGDGEPRFISRNDNDLGQKALAAEIAKSINTTAILDGEIVSLNAEGRSDFGLLRIQLSENSPNIRFVAFDLVRVNDVDLRGEPLRHRIELLEKLVSGKKTGRLMLSPVIEGEAKAILTSACKIGLEGVVAKRLESPYTGVRSSDWIKLKCRRADAATVIGFTIYEADSHAIGALLLAERKDDGLAYIGKVGSGFSLKERKDFYTRLMKIKADKSAATGVPRVDAKGVSWVKPSLSIHFQFAERTNAGYLRQASYQGEDKVQAEETPPAVPAKAFTPTKVKLTHPDRVIDPSTGATKQDLFDYYHQFGSLLMPHITGRFVATLRCPDGVEGECFFQKHMMAGTYKGLAELPDEDDKYVTIKNETGISELVQMSVVEFHPWGSRIKTVEKPDVLIFDLDPSPEVAWDDVVEAADFVRGRLSSIGLEPFYKLSGGKGIHLVLSIKPELEWPDAKAFCKSFAERMAAEKPKLFLSTMSKDKRKGKIFVDYLRNGRGATAVAPYCVRSRPGLPIAMPVTWDEFVQSNASSDFKLPDVAKYLTSRKTDPWQDFAKKQVSIRKVLGVK